MDTIEEKIVRKLILDYETQIYRELIRNNQEMQQIQRERLEIAHNYPFIFDLFERGSPEDGNEEIRISIETEQMIYRIIKGFARESELKCKGLYRLGFRDCLYYVRETHVSPVLKGDDEVAVSIGGIG